MRVVRTDPRAGYVTRRLRCSDCGERQTTVERPVNQATPSTTAIGDGQLAVSIGLLVEALDLLKDSDSQSGDNQQHSTQEQNT